MQKPKKPPDPAPPHLLCSSLPSLSSFTLDFHPLRLNTARIFALNWSLDCPSHAPSSTGITSQFIDPLSAIVARKSSLSKILDVTIGLTIPDRNHWTPAWLLIRPRSRLVCFLIVYRFSSVPVVPDISIQMQGSSPEAAAALLSRFETSFTLCLFQVCGLLLCPILSLFHLLWCFSDCSLLCCCTKFGLLSLYWGIRPGYVCDCFRLPCCFSWGYHSTLVLDASGRFGGKGLIGLLALFRELAGLRFASLVTRLLKPRCLSGFLCLVLVSVAYNAKYFNAVVLTLSFSFGITIDLSHLNDWGKYFFFWCNPAKLTWICAYSLWLSNFIDSMALVHCEHVYVWLMVLVLPSMMFHHAHQGLCSKWWRVSLTFREKLGLSFPGSRFVFLEIFLCCLEPSHWVLHSCLGLSLTISASGLPCPVCAVGIISLICVWMWGQGLCSSTPMVQLLYTRSFWLCCQVQHLCLPRLQLGLIGDAPHREGLHQFMMSFCARPLTVWAELFLSGRFPSFWLSRLLVSLYAQKDVTRHPYFCWHLVFFPDCLG